MRMGSFWRIGQIIEFSQTLGTQHSLKDQLNKLANTLHKCEVHTFNNLPLMLSGHAAFLTFSFINNDLTTFALISSLFLLHIH